MFKGMVDRRQGFQDDWRGFYIDLKSCITSMQIMLARKAKVSNWLSWLEEFLLLQLFKQLLLSPPDVFHPGFIELIAITVFFYFSWVLWAYEKIFQDCFLNALLFWFRIPDACDSFLLARWYAWCFFELQLAGGTGVLEIQAIYSYLRITLTVEAINSAMFRINASVFFTFL